MMYCGIILRIRKIIIIIIFNYTEVQVFIPYTTKDTVSGSHIDRLPKQLEHQSFPLVLLFHIKQRIVRSPAILY